MGSDVMNEGNPDRRFRALFISDVHLGAAAPRPTDCSIFSSITTPRRSISSAILSMAGRCGRAGTGPNRITTSSRRCCARCARARLSSTCPAIMTNSCSPTTERISAALRLSRTRSKGADGRRYLVIHGDIFDLVVQNARWLAHLGDKAYDFAIQMNRLVNGSAAGLDSRTGRCRNGRSSRSRTR